MGFGKLLEQGFQTDLRRLYPDPSNGSASLWLYDGFGVQLTNWDRDRGSSIHHGMFAKQDDLGWRGGGKSGHGLKLRQKM
jgi:hypothetical protein